MLRFDLKVELETHDLGRSLLLMLHDDDIGLQVLPQSMPFAAPVNPFDAIRTRLAAVDSAFQGLQAQLHVVLHLSCKCSIAGVLVLALHTAVCGFLSLPDANTL